PVTPYTERGQRSVRINSNLTDGRSFQYEERNGQVTRFELDGKLVPAHEYDRYRKELSEIQRFDQSAPVTPRRQSERFNRPPPPPPRTASPGGGGTSFFQLPSRLSEDQPATRYILPGRMNSGFLSRRDTLPPAGLTEAETEQIRAAQRQLAKAQQQVARAAQELAVARQQAGLAEKEMRLNGLAALEQRRAMLDAQLLSWEEERKVSFEELREQQREMLRSFEESRQEMEETRREAEVLRRAADRMRTAFSEKYTRFMVLFDQVMEEGLLPAGSDKQRIKLDADQLKVGGKKYPAALERIKALYQQRYGEPFDLKMEITQPVNRD
ncbi:MAG: hypothetical protein WBA17_05510, partial [Saprospiraceae bacterium]